MEEDLDAQLAGNRAYERTRATGRDTKGRHLGRRPNAWVAPTVPDAMVSVTDPDSRHIKANDTYVQGYNAQAVVDERPIVLAAEITNSTVDLSQLSPMITADDRRARDAGRGWTGPSVGRWPTRSIGTSSTWIRWSPTSTSRS